MGTTIAPSAEQSRSYTLIAPVWHTILLGAFLCVPLVSGIIAQLKQTPNNQILPSHAAAMAHFYIPALFYEWFLILFVWGGIRGRGMTLNELIGGRWSGAKDVLRDIGLGLLMIIVMLAVGAGLGRILGPGHGKDTSVILPQGGFELVLWALISLSAGVAEELVFRGYLQIQFTRMGLSTLTAILAQAILFAIVHIYEGT